MNLYTDKRIVLTLDAGGTNFVFNAFMGGKAMLEGIRKDPNAEDLGRCLDTLKQGFQEVIQALDAEPVAISFAFPGPADYRRGIIGDLGNLPGFRGGVPLKDILEDEFNLPVFINNDGDLYAYGEALGGILPEINADLEASGSPKRYRNLIGLTLGTGFGGGFVSDGRLITGDNSIASEVWLFSNMYYPGVNAEDAVSTRSVQRVYAKEAGISFPNELMPRDIYQIATGEKAGDRDAALKAYEETGKALGDTVANLLTLSDGIVIIGGGITGARELYMPAMMNVLRSDYSPSEGGTLPRLVQRIYNLDEDKDRQAFCKDYSTTIAVPGTERKVSYDPQPRLAVATSKIGASEAIALGAYAIALEQLPEGD